MKDIGILFKGEMVQAIQRPINYKTQTRRIITGPRYGLKVNSSPIEPSIIASRIEETPEGWMFYGGHLEVGPVRCPYGKTGDRLYVRETWQHSNWPNGPYDDDCHVFFRADYLDDVHGPDGELSPEGRYRWWQSPLHLPKNASRIWLDNKGVRVERLQDISEADCMAEGVYLFEGGGYKIARGWQEYDTTVDAYAAYIDHINGAGTWASNPLVWVVSFDKHAPIPI